MPRSPPLSVDSGAMAAHWDEAIDVSGAVSPTALRRHQTDRSPPPKCQQTSLPMPVSRGEAPPRWVRFRNKARLDCRRGNLILLPDEGPTYHRLGSNPVRGRHNLLLEGT